MRKWTIAFIVFMVLAIAIYDIWAIAVGGNHASISQVMIGWAYQAPLFPLAVGIVLGHLFWRMPDGKGTDKLKGGR